MPPRARASSSAGSGTRSSERGFIREERIYRPHVTLARRARPVEAEVEPVEWHVAELALVESLPDGRNVHYEVLETLAAVSVAVLDKRPVSRLQ